MKQLDALDYARKLLEAHGGRAEAEAAQKAAACEAEGETRNTEDWRRIRLAIRELRSAPVS